MPVEAIPPAPGGKPIPIVPILTPTSAQLASRPDLEAIIVQNCVGIYRVWLALSAKQARKLYKQEGFRSFAEYLRARWDGGRAHTYREIA